MLSEEAETPAGDDNGEFIEKKKREKKDNKQRNNYRSNNKRPPQSARPAPRVSANNNNNQKKANDQPLAQPSGAQAAAEEAEVTTPAPVSQAPRRESSEVVKTFGEKFDEEKAKYLERFKGI